VEGSWQPAILTTTRWNKFASQFTNLAPTQISAQPEIWPRSLDYGLQKAQPSARDDNPNEPVPILRIMAVYHMYIMASASGVLYTGVTNHLERRVAEHKQKLHDGFTKKYDITRLVYFEPFDQVKSAISREKQIKSWRRDKKLILIRTRNPQFRDLSEDFPR
jgi:putative endonuclease